MILDCKFLDRKKVEQCKKNSTGPMLDNFQLFPEHFVRSNVTGCLSLFCYFVSVETNLE